MFGVWEGLLERGVPMSACLWRSEEVVSLWELVLQVIVSFPVGVPENPNMVLCKTSECS